MGVRNPRGKSSMGVFVQGVNGMVGKSPRG